MNTIVLEAAGTGNVTPVDVYQRLLDTRVIFLSGFIDDKSATDIVASLFLKNIESETDKITIMLNAEGGDIRSVFMIYNIMKLVKCPIEVICTGACMAEPALLLSAGTRGMRLATKHATIGISQLSYIDSGMNAYYSLEEAKKKKELIEMDNERFFTELAKNCKKTYKQFLKTFSSRTFLTPTEGIKHGIIDAICEK